jgi:hypothetical protein
VSERAGSSVRTSDPAGWYLSLYPQAGEGGGCFVSSYRPERTYVARGKAANPERAASEAARRARAKVRRYGAANSLNRLGTLTYGPPRSTDPAEVREHVGLFFRGLRAGLGDRPLPYMWVPELHKDGEHFHVHFAVGRYVQRRLISSAWGRGIVDIRLIGDLPVGSGVLAESRKAAGYLSKYVTKTFTDPTTRVVGMHRYDVAQGFQPRKVSLHGRSAEEVLGQASEMFGVQPARRWSSAETEDWSGPPAIWAQWGQ